MSHNFFGKLLRVTSFGESHGPGVGCVIDGLPPGLTVDVERIEAALKRRATGTSRHTSQRREADAVRVLSGVFEGQTTGTALALWIENTDARSKDYAQIAQQFRPGHADYTYQQKYGLRDYRGGGRSSARETTVRVAAGVLARAWLEHQFGIRIAAYLAQLGEIPCAAAFTWEAVNANPFFCPDASQVSALEEYMDQLRKDGDSVGARVTVVAQGVPPGLGEPVYGKLDAELAAAMMSINAVKAVEIGAGFACVSQKGSTHRDELSPQGFASNHAGGILGGISSGQELVVSMAFKPTSSIRIPGQSIDMHGQPCEVVTLGRHDPCVGIRAVPIAEAMMALVLMDQVLRHRAQCADVPVQASRIAAGQGLHPPISASQHL